MEHDLGSRGIALARAGRRPQLASLTLVTHHPARHAETERPSRLLPFGPERLRRVPASHHAGARGGTGRAPPPVRRRRGGRALAAQGGRARALAPRTPAG